MTAHDNFPVYRRPHRLTIAFIISFALLISSLTVEAASPPTLINPDELKYPDLQFTIPQAERIVLDNGLILFYLEDHEVPLVTISAVVRCGSVYDPVGKEGLAELTARVMRTGGTGKMTGNMVDEELEYLAAIVNVSLGKESGSATLSVLKKDLDPALRIYSQMLMNPAFEQEKVKLAKELKIEELKRIEDDPQKLAFREFNRILYRHNPRGRLPTRTSVKNIGQSDLVSFYKRFFSPGNFMFAITGDITRGEAIEKMNRYFGDWHAEVEKVQDVPPPEKQQGAIYFLPKNIPQAVIIYGQLAPAAKDDDSYSFEILDFILGSGGFTSRIFQEVRNKRGFAYSTGSYYQGRADYGVFGAYALTKSESVAETLKLIRSILLEVRNQGVKRKEYELARKSIINRFIFSFLSASQIAGQQLMIEYDRLPPDYLLKYREKIHRIPLDRLKTVADKYLLGNDAIFFVLGEEKIYDQLQTQFSGVHRIEKTDAEQ